MISAKIGPDSDLLVVIKKDNSITLYKKQGDKFLLQEVSNEPTNTKSTD